MSDDDGFVQPEHGFRFDEQVTAGFDDMLARSVPDYERMRQVVAALGAEHVDPARTVVDLGASRGEATARLMGATDRRPSRFELVETSPPMRRAAETRFEAEVRSGLVRTWDVDLRRTYPTVSPASLTLAVLTLQFVPIEHRQRLVADVHEHTAPGGALLVVEKVLAGTARLGRELVAVHDAAKRASGYSEEEIDRNLLALEGVLVPVTARWNEELLHAGGFGHVECVWRCLNFAAWLALRD